jgi:hypothetical protein
MRGHLVRDGEAAEALFFHRVHLDGKSLLAACFDTPRHGQTVEPLHKARDAPVAVPGRPGIILAGDPLAMRRLRKRQGARAALSPPR